VSAGIDTDAVTPWNAVQNTPQTPRSTGAQERESPTASAAATEALDAPVPEDGSPAAWMNRSGRPRTASRQIVFSQESLSIADSINITSPLAEDAAEHTGDSIRVACRRAQDGSADGNSADVLTLETDEVLSTGCTTPVAGSSPLPLQSMAEQDSSSSSVALPLGSVGSSSSSRFHLRPTSVRFPFSF
jgi:hypothetical protein